MKVGLVVYEQLSSRSGGYLYDRMLVDHLRNKGDEVKVVSMPGCCSTRWLVNNVNPRLFDTLRDLDVDVLVEDELCHHSLCLLNRRLRKNIRYPIVGLFHFLASKAEPDRMRAHRLEVVERRFISTLDGCIFNSAATAEAARCLFPACQGVVAHPGCDHVRPVSAVRERSNQFTILFIGNITPDKGLDVLVRAMTSLPMDRFRLEVAGPAVDPGFLTQTYSLAEHLSVERCVRFWGWVNEEERQYLMRKADVLVVPSYFEGYGLVLVEAMACGLPTIAPLCGGAKEIVRQREEGFLVRPGDSAAIADHLRRLEEDRLLWQRMSAQASKRFGQLPTWGEEMEKAREHLLAFAER